MSARTNGAPLWWIRPIIDGVIREDLGQPFAGTIDAAMERANALHLQTGLRHSVTDVQP